MPLPIMTYSADCGKSAVDRRSAISSGGSCQYETVGLAGGRAGGIWARDCMEGRDIVEMLEKRKALEVCVLAESYRLGLRKVVIRIVVCGLA